MEKKITKKENFKMLRELVQDRQDLVAFINHELELLDNKNNSKTQTKTQKENEGIKEIIVNALTKFEEPVIITTLQSASEQLSTLSNQKISALLTQLIKEQKIKRVVIKKQAHFSIISA